MALNPNLIVTASLQELFRDKDTGLPLRSGQIYFYKDNARTVPKNLYQQTGAPPNYSATALPNPLTLTGVGTFSNGSNADIIPLWWPYEGNPTDPNPSGTIELYYIEVYSSDGVLQFTREGWPYNFSGGGPTPDSGNQFEDYVPNGQFLIHNYFDSDVAVAGTSIPIAPGGWYFERSTGDGQDFIIFPRFDGTISSNPSGFPRYSAELFTTAGGTDSYKGLRLRFKSVNTFSGGNFTIFFSGQTIAPVNSVSITVKAILHYGTGGTPHADETQVIETVTLTQTSTDFWKVWNFPSTVGKILGTNNDDYLKICFDMVTPTSTTDFSITDVLIAPGDITDELDANGYPCKTSYQFESQSLVPPTPTYDGSKLYLPLILTPRGIDYDVSQIGFIYANNSSNVPEGYLPCDGLTNYSYSSYSSIGIPYKRLADKLWDSTSNSYLNNFAYGYLTAYISNTDSTTLRLTTNYAVAGPISPTADGTGGHDTGFAFSTLHSTGSYGYEGNITAPGHIHFSATVIGFPKNQGLPATLNGGTPGTATNLYLAINNYYLDVGIKTTPDGTFSEFDLIVNSSFTQPGPFDDATFFYLTNTTTNYYVWFPVNGVGNDPAPSAIPGIRIDMKSSYTTTECANIIREALSGLQVSLVTCNAASTLNDGDYFTASTNGLSTPSAFSFYYDKSGSASPPSVVGHTPVRVLISNSDTAAQVATKTKAAINKAYFGTPDLRGTFLRGWDNGSNTDPDHLTRFSNNSEFYGDHVGTMQETLNLVHMHPFSNTDFSHNIAPAAWVDVVSGGDFNVTVTAGNTDIDMIGTSGQDWLSPNDRPKGSESRPINTTVQWIIKY